MKIEDLRINQKVKVSTWQYPEWNDLECRIVGLSIDRYGKENITLDDGSGYQYDGWTLSQVIIIDTPP